MSDVNNIFAGPGTFIWGVNADGSNATDAMTIDLTQGGIRFYTETTYFEPTTDQTGTVPVDAIATGTKGMVEFMTPDMDFNNVVKYNPNASKVENGGKVKFQVTGLAGKKLPFKRAVIKPQGITDPNRYIYIEECAIKFDVDAGYKLDDNLKLSIKGTARPSLTATPKGLLYTWGDITATA
jgi:hypothetical protein